VNQEPAVQVSIDGSDITIQNSLLSATFSPSVVHFFSFHRDVCLPILIDSSFRFRTGPLRR
jgi:hypothetical protein